MSAIASALRPTLRASSGAALSTRSFSSSSSRSIARIMITGRLAGQPEVQATASGQEVIRYTVASNQNSRDKRPPSFFKVSAFSEGNQRDFITNLQTGTLVFVEGDATMRQWENAEGKKQTALNITQRALEVLKRPYNPEAFSEEQQHQHQQEE
ncbi:nucleic acid-binding protein [Aspergillus piperis CBS 112811]|uniref:Nucleic acid-binding protein n=1 Tax=Aspergillus piperis CBS 112811 TaxID=1448313 RepID=A0A8G1R916_9EURO|nr:nucleic acid-binding protein [Aspergillus piperis CBS 112811]RAH61518.1 nucleic acid-binding protein [Aspergillus piperis CBS 112811]